MTFEIDILPVCSVVGDESLNIFFLLIPLFFI